MVAPARRGVTPRREDQGAEGKRADWPTVMRAGSAYCRR